MSSVRTFKSSSTLYQELSKYVADEFFTKKKMIETIFSTPSYINLTAESRIQLKKLMKSKKFSPLIQNNIVFFLDCADT